MPAVLYLYCQTVLTSCVCGFRVTRVLSPAGHLHPDIRSEERSGFTLSQYRFPSCPLKTVSPLSAGFTSLEVVQVSDNSPYSPYGSDPRC